MLRTGYITTAVLACLMTGLLSAQTMIVANDQKIDWDASGTQLRIPENASQDRVCIFDLSACPYCLREVACLPLENSVYGPPTNLAITPDEKLAVVANPVKLLAQGNDWEVVPNNELHIIDLSATPPKHVRSIQVGQQPSGMDISPSGQCLLIANRADDSVTVLTIEGQDVTVIKTVDIGVPVADVCFTPSGKRALLVQKQNDKIGILHIRGTQIGYNPKEDINVGISPYNVEVSPDGAIALVANSGVTGGNDGNVDTVSVVDLQATPPRVINSVPVGDGPEGLAISPTGKLAVAVLINGSQNAQSLPETAWAYHKNGKVAVLEIKGKQVRKVGEVEVGSMPEGVVFSPDGQFIYVGNFLSDTLSVLRVEGNQVVDTGRTVPLCGSPAAMRAAW